MNRLINTKNNISPIYVIDYLNVFSDYREIKYKKLNIDFHTVKHKNKEIDTVSFFKLFFNKYISSLNINKNSKFIFVLKKITNYDTILYNIIEQYKDINIRFIIIENKYSNVILDKNKDDFLCQYIFNYLITNNNCVLISNDKYKDNKSYVYKFEHASINVIKKAQNNLLIENSTLTFSNIICNKIINNNNNNKIAIPKHNLSLLI